MNQKGTDRAPRARVQGLIIQELADEVLVYDEDRNKAVCLNHTAALVWRYCDGKTTVTSMTRQLERDLKTEGVDEKIVWYALDQLGKDHLLVEPAAAPAVLAGMSRRQLVRVLGVAAVVAIPVVTSIVAPTVVEAATCLPPSQPCTTSAQCCSGLCSGGVCA
jgi:hypothetical protein